MKTTNHILVDSGVNGGYLLPTDEIKTRTEDKNKKIKAKIKTYTDLCIKKLQKGLELPSGGDCWFCSMRDVEGKPWGDARESDYFHLKEHLKEKYVVPSLIFNAVSEAGYQYPTLILGYSQETEKSRADYLMVDASKRAITKYLQKRLLIKP